MKLIVFGTGLLTALLITISPAQADVVQSESAIDIFSARTAQLAEGAREARYRCSRDTNLSDLPETTDFINQLVAETESLSTDISIAPEITGSELKNFASLLEQVLSALEKSGCQQA